MTILNIFLELFFPRLCINCQTRLIESEKYICIKCLLEIPITDHLKVNTNKLEKSFSGRFPFNKLASFAYFSKGGVIQKMIHEIKYRNNPNLAIYIGNLCGTEIKKQTYFGDIDFIVPIPLHKKRLKKRGYNQSLLIAQGIAEMINKPIDDTILKRKINNPSQTKKNRIERWENINGVFDIAKTSILDGKHILLIDDVITTGATIEACSKLLQSQGATVSIYCVGSTL